MNGLSFSYIGTKQFFLYALQSFAAESADAFEALPIWGEKADILRNILYSGLWMRYAAIRQKRTGDYRKEEV